MTWRLVYSAKSQEGHHISPDEHIGDQTSYGPAKNGGCPGFFFSLRLGRDLHDHGRETFARLHLELMHHVGGYVQSIAGFDRVPGSSLDRLASYFICAAGGAVHDLTAYQHGSFAGPDQQKVRLFHMDLGLAISVAVGDER